MVGWSVYNVSACAYNVQQLYLLLEERAKEALASHCNICISTWTLVFFLSLHSEDFYAVAVFFLFEIV